MNLGGSSNVFPVLPLFNIDSDEVKNAHDSYDVYVNEEFIGKKILLTETEEVEDIVSFLNKQGIKDIADHLEGDHYIIKTDEAERVKHILDTYLQNR